MNNNNWGKFHIEDLFDVKRGNAKNITNKKQTGAVALISAISSNNGIYSFTTAEESELQMNNIYTINNNGEGVCLCYYHRYNVIASSDVTFLYPKYKELCDVNIAIFIKTIIENQKQKYSYGYKMNDDRLKKQVILLPVISENKIDFLYMKNYILRIKDKLKEEYKNYYDDFIKINDISTFPATVNYSEKKWKPFRITDIFTYDRGNQSKMNTLTKNGNTPLVSAKNGNNGLKDFVYNTEKKIYDGNTISFNNDGDGGVGYAFYQPYNYLLDSHCYSLKLIDNQSKYIYLFMTVVLSKQRSLFSHGRSISEPRLNNLKIMLPVNEKGQPDYMFMENLIKSIIKNKCNMYFDINNKC